MLKSSFLFAAEQYRSWLLTPRILVAVYMIIFLNESVTLKIMELCAETGYHINLAEPLALIFSKNVYAVAIPLVFISLMTDFPKTEGSVFYISRMSRTGFVLGELMFAAMSSLTYIIALISGTALCCIGKCSFNNEWSDFTAKCYIEYPELYRSNTSLFVTSSVYTQGKPIEVILHSAALIFLYIMLLSLIIMLFKLLNTGGVGVVFSTAITLSGLATYGGASPMMWAFPITHTVFGWHFDGFYREQFFTLTGSYIYLTVLIAVLLTANLIISKKARL